MRILHTSDWHIGKKLMGRDRSPEFISVLNEIADICRDERVELCLVAGDVFDTYTPAAEAEEIFYNAVKNIARYCAVLIISGNHDDYVRLTAAAALAGELGIYIVGNNLSAIKCKKTGECYPAESDDGWVIFENSKGERVYIDALPYPNEARFKEGKSDETFDDKMRRWIDFGERGNVAKLPSVFLSHIFALGGSVDGTEREIDLGGARLVKTELLPDCDYIALGHLHKRQRLGKNVYYSGAIMNFSFDEAATEKSVNIFDLGADGVKNLRLIALKSIKKLVRLQALSAEEGIRLLNENAESYAELTLNLSQPLNHTQTVELHRCANLVSLKTNVEGINYGAVAATRRGKSASQLFSDYYKIRYNAEPSDKLKELFLSLTEEE